MSVTGVSSSSSLGQSLQTWQAKAQKTQSEFQQLGQDLQAGNLSQAQADFSSLSQNVSTPLQSNSTLTQAFSTLGSALQSGNVSAAQQAYTALQQDVQQAGQGHHHHHQHAGSGSETSSSSAGGTLSQLFSSLASALQSGNLSAAQTAYSTLAQGLQQLGGSSGASSSSMAGAVSLIG
jgi:outer membrane protein assembly factor BamD (BamD/ComL family)